jgi:predicted ATPase with chaperone activity
MTIVIASDEKAVMPKAPRTIEEAGLSVDLVLQLVTKTLHSAGELTGTELASRLGVNFPILEPALAQLKNQRHCEITGGGITGAATYRYRLTDAGQSRAALFLEHNQYIGVLPVPIAQYQAYMCDHGRPSVATSRDEVHRAFRHLVLSERVLDQLGPAIAVRHSLFLYGPPGNGKTVISQAIRQLIAGDLAIPHALAVDNNVIRVFDAVNHERVESETESIGLERTCHADHRWVRCRRPVVTVGGELTLSALELQDGHGGLYRAPLQAIANGGVLVIDDFGRQQISPRELLNRWTVPLDTRVDYMTLRTGQTFELPFETFVVFATNLKPAELLDEAFLRRLRYKVLAQSPTEDEFIHIFENCCREKNLTFDRCLVERLLQTELRPRGIQLRGCQPRDLIDHAMSLASYLDQPRALTLDLLAASCASYFVEEGVGA